MHPLGRPPGGARALRAVLAGAAALASVLAAAGCGRFGGRNRHAGSAPAMGG